MYRYVFKYSLHLNMQTNLDIHTPPSPPPPDMGDVNTLNT